MKIVRTVAEMQALALRCLRQGRRIGFVPTMGALHDGHLSLVRRARQETDVVVVSIFVNPLQFGAGEDLRRYPRTLARDRKLLQKEKADILFAPPETQMVGRLDTRIMCCRLTDTLCGPLRPGHFEGVATIVVKLFQMVRPTRAYFGFKDFQQLRIVEKVVKDLAIPVRVVACPTVRESDGLALSSRNRYLTRGQRENAVRLYQTLFLGRELVEGRIFRESALLIRRLRQVLSAIPGARIDYVAVVDPETLQPMKRIFKPCLLALAVRLGRARLIDSLLVA